MSVRLFKSLIIVGVLLAIAIASFNLLPLRQSHAQDPQNPASQKIESDDARVAQSGTWSNQAANGASAGSYLFSSGSDTDVLSLAFEGSALEILYNAGPSLGTLAIEVDGTVLRTVITADSETRYGQSAKINYLTDEPHTLKVYGQGGGVIAIDAFIVEGLVMLPSQTQDMTPAVESLATIAEKNGTIRVIIGFDAPFVPEGKLSNAQAIQAQRTQINQTRATLINRLANTTAHIHAASQDWVIPYLAAEVDAATLQAIAALPDVISITEDRVSRLSLDVSTNLVDADAAWALGYDGTDMTVAILDTGVEANHSFLEGRVVAEACFSSTGGENISLCPNGQTSQIGPGAGAPGDCLELGCDHGTHVAGIAAGDGPTFNGVAPNANIIAVQVFTETICHDPFTNGPCVVTYTSDWISGLNHVYSLRTTYNIAAVNMSFSGGPSLGDCDDATPAATAAINLLASVNIASVVASGNDLYGFWISFPSCISAAVAVGATNDTDQIANFSNVSEMLDFFAPGVGINSSVVNNQFASYNGTSMSTPHVVGAWALIRDAVPSASLNQILTALRETGRWIIQSSYNTAKPRIDIDDALLAVLNPLPIPNIPANATVTNPTPTSQTLNWEDNSSNELGFRVYRAEVPQFENRYYRYIGVVPPNTTTFPAFTNLSCGTRYEYKLVAFNGSGESQPAILAQTTAACAIPNDSMDAGIAINSLPYTNTQEILGSTPGFLSEASQVCGPVQNTVWYRYTPSTSQRVTIQAQGTSQFPPIVAVYSGAFHLNSRVACGGQVTWDALKGTPYYILAAPWAFDVVTVSTMLTLNVTGTPLAASTDSLAIFSPLEPNAYLTYSLNSPLPSTQRYPTFRPSLIRYTPWVMGDWNGDGQKTPAYFRHGAFFYTDSFVAIDKVPFTGVWLGPNGIPVAGRFSPTHNNDCIGVIHSAEFPPYGTAFAFYYTCDLTSGPTPTIHFQWLSVVLPDSGGFSGAHQFVAGDWDGDGLDSVAIRRGAFVAFTNVAPVSGHAIYDLAQYFGTPSSNDYGYFVAGDWDNNQLDSFGLVYQNGRFYRRNDLDWNSGVYLEQNLALPSNTTPFIALSWRVN